MSVVKYTLDQIVREYLIELGDNNLSKYKRFLQYGIAGLRELHMKMTAVPKVIIITVDTDTMTAPLPQDYIQYTTIGICGADGRIYSLGKLDDICLARRKNDCGMIIAPGTSTNDSAVNFQFIRYGDGYGDHIRNGELTGRFFGLGGGNNQNGNFRIDTEMGQIQLSSDALNRQVTSDTDVPSELVMEYISRLSPFDGNFEVHPFILETLKAFMYWSSIRRKRNYGIGEKIEAERVFKSERKESNSRFQAFTMDEALETIRKAVKMAPKQ